MYVLVQNKWSKHSLPIMLHLGQLHSRFLHFLPRCLNLWWLLMEDPCGLMCMPRPSKLERTNFISIFTIFFVCRRLSLVNKSFSYISHYKVCIVVSSQFSQMVAGKWAVIHRIAGEGWIKLFPGKLHKNIDQMTKFI